VGESVIKCYDRRNAWQTHNPRASLFRNKQTPPGANPRHALWQRCPWPAPLGDLRRRHGWARRRRLRQPRPRRGGRWPGFRTPLQTAATELVVGNLTWDSIHRLDTRAVRWHTGPRRLGVLRCAGAAAGLDAGRRLPRRGARPRRLRHHGLRRQRCLPIAPDCCRSNSIQEHPGSDARVHRSAPSVILGHRASFLAGSKLPSDETQ
jgi:hypothetical protein